MSECNKETLKLIATILGNVAAIAIGVALFDGKIEGIAVTVILLSLWFETSAFRPI